mmetsp:Transcript_22256/g.56196  ORF Transcript_22256/g.56196 Transcript_22256/m.56196 type:complete len:83 (+) Transcript_22256:1300-1548(+)
MVSSTSTATDDRARQTRDDIFNVANHYQPNDIDNDNDIIFATLDQIILSTESTTFNTSTSAIGSRWLNVARLRPQQRLRAGC